MTTNTETKQITDEAMDNVVGGFGFSFTSLFGLSSPPSLPHAPTPKSLGAAVTNYFVSHSPIGAVGHALKFW